MSKYLVLILILLAIAVGLFVYKKQQAPAQMQPVQTVPSATPTQTVGLANPASVHCAKLGGKDVIVTDAKGNQYGMCHLKDGRVCEEWELFRTGKCKPSL